MISTPKHAVPQSAIAILTKLHKVAQARGVTCYLVGGFLRDQLLCRLECSINVDMSVPSGALSFAQTLASQMSGAFVPLDEEVGSARVVVHMENERFELDVSDFRGADIEEDLRKRDFTVNAMAVSLSDWLDHPQSPQTLIDPLKGQKALRDGILIACFPGAFEDDPLRILRAFRFQSQLDFSLDAQTQHLMGKAVSLLRRVSGERIRDELIAIFETIRSHDAIQALNALGVLDVVFPELVRGRGMVQGGVHHLDVLAHQIETLAQADRLFNGFDEFSESLRQPLEQYCAEEMVEGRSRRALIKLAGLLHDVGKPTSRQVHPDGEIWFIGHEHAGADLVAGIVERLRLSNRESTMICQIVRNHLRPGLLSREPELTRRAIYRFYKDMGDDGPACLLTWWNDRMATRGPASRLDQLDQQRSRLEEMMNPYFFKAEEMVKPPRLTSGNQLMEAFGLSSGPLIGDLLEAIQEAQAEGQVRSPGEALVFAQAYLARRKAK